MYECAYVLYLKFDALYSLILLIDLINNLFFEPPIDLNFSSALFHAIYTVSDFKLYLK